MTSKIKNQYATMLNRNSNAFIEKYPDYTNVIVAYNRIYLKEMENNETSKKLARLLMAFDSEVESSIQYIKETKND